MQSLAAQLEPSIGKAKERSNFKVRQPISKVTPNKNEMDTSRGTTPEPKKSQKMLAKHATKIKNKEISDMESLRSGLR